MTILNTSSLQVNTSNKNIFSVRKHSGTRSKTYDLSSSDLFATVMNKTIAIGIDSYLRNITKREKEVFKYLAFYFRKWGGNIEIPIKNLMDRFGVCRSWIQELLRRLYDHGLIVTTGGGYGRKVTKRTFTERGKIVWDAISKGVKAVKQVVHKTTGHYSGHYSPGDTNYISSKVDIPLRKVAYDFPEEEIKSHKLTPELKLKASDSLLRAREMLRNGN